MEPLQKGPFQALFKGSLGNPKMFSAFWVNLDGRAQDIPQKM